MATPESIPRVLVPRPPSPDPRVLVIPILKMEFPENITGNILDEIALEGLEGVTISSVYYI